MKFTRISYDPGLSGACNRSTRMIKLQAGRRLEEEIAGAHCMLRRTLTLTQGAGQDRLVAYIQEQVQAAFRQVYKELGL